MLTPKFELRQSNEHLIVCIETPYAKGSDFEVHFENTQFVFTSEPYFLRLKLPGKVLYDESPFVAFDSDKKQFKIHAPKQNKGEVFECLDPMACLCVLRHSEYNPPFELEDEEDLNEELEEKVIDWRGNTKLSQEPFDNSSFENHKCGFANQHSFPLDLLTEVFDVTSPLNKSAKERRKERILEENKNFKEEHYLCDKFYDDEIQVVLAYKPEWQVLYEKFEARRNIIIPKREENMKKMELESKNFCLDASQKRKAMLGLIDILFAYAYNIRTMEGENTVESGWTINKLSATLSWLEELSTLKDVVISGIRRSLIYPLYRHYELALTVMEDVKKILMLGKTYIEKCLFDMYDVFCDSEEREIFNDLFIKDYASWVIFECSADDFVPYVEKLQKIHPTKDDLGLNLGEIEKYATLALKCGDILQNTDTGSEEEDEDSTESEAVASELNKLSLGSTPLTSRQCSSSCSGCSACCESGSSDNSTSGSYEASDEESDNSCSCDEDDNETEKVSTSEEKPKAC